MVPAVAVLENEVQVGKQAAASSPAPPATKPVSKSKPNMSVPSCCSCGIVVSDDMRALQCDRCMSNDAWKCAECLNICSDMYDKLLTDPNFALRWFCDLCEQVAMNMKIDDCAAELCGKIHTMLQDMNTSLSCLNTSDRQEEVSKMLEKILVKVDNIEQVVRAKADTVAVVQLEKRLQSLEDKLQLNSNMMQKLQDEEAERCSLNCKVDDVVAMLSEKCDEWKNCIANDVVLEQMQNKLTEEEIEKEEQEKRRNSMIVFGLKESCSSDVEVRVADDVEKMQMIMNELEINQETNICKVIRLL